MRYDRAFMIHPAALFGDELEASQLAGVQQLL
jgi:hypothetical protein